MKRITSLAVQELVNDWVDQKITDEWESEQREPKLTIEVSNIDHNNTMIRVAGLGAPRYFNVKLSEVL